MKTLIDSNVALTSTLTVFETFTPGRPMPPGVDVLVPQLRDQFDERHAAATSAGAKQSIYTTLLPEDDGARAARSRAPAGCSSPERIPPDRGGVVPGYSNQRQLELLVEAGFTPVEAIRIGTLNGAKYLGRDARIGSIAVGKQADLVLVTGDPSTTIADVRKVDTVFRQGVGFDPAALIKSVTGRVGIW